MAAKSEGASRPRTEPAQGPLGRIRAPPVVGLFNRTRRPLELAPESPIVTVPGHSPTTDSAGNTVWDCGDPNFAAADIDAVYVANSKDVATVGRPWVELSMEEFPNGTYMVLEMGDPDGLWDIIPAITASSNGVSGNFYNLLKFFTFLELDDTHVRMAAGPVIPQLPRTQFRVSVSDGTGQKSGDAVYFP